MCKRSKQSVRNKRKRAMPTAFAASKTLAAAPITTHTHL
jgi:hypothetical protein